MPRGASQREKRRRPRELKRQLPRQRAQRHALMELTKSFPVVIRGKRPVEEAIVTSGGVSVREIDNRSMQSRLVEGLRNLPAPEDGVTRAPEGGSPPVEEAGRASPTDTSGPPRAGND